MRDLTLQFQNKFSKPFSKTFEQYFHRIFLCVRVLQYAWEMAGVCFGCCGGYFQYLCPDSSPAALQHIRDKLQKTRQKLHSKNLWNWVVILVSATIWQALNGKCTRTRNGNDVNQLKIALKNSWNHIKWTYFRRILPIWNHNVLPNDYNLH